jgi:hypothetical protein
LRHGADSHGGYRKRTEYRRQTMPSQGASFLARMPLRYFVRVNDQRITSAENASHRLYKRKF